MQLREQAAVGANKTKLAKEFGIAGKLFTNTFARNALRMGKGYTEPAISKRFFLHSARRNMTHIQLNQIL